MRQLEAEKARRKYKKREEKKTNFYDQHFHKMFSFAMVLVSSHTTFTAPRHGAVKALHQFSSFGAPDPRAERFFLLWKSSSACARGARV